MKLGFICLNLPGHLNPMTALARELQARNHDVVFFIRQVLPAYRFIMLRGRITLTKTDQP